MVALAASLPQARRTPILRFRELHRLEIRISILAVLLPVVAIVHPVRRNFFVSIGRLPLLMVQTVDPVIIHLFLPRFRERRLFCWEQTSGRLLKTFHSARHHDAPIQKHPCKQHGSNRVFHHFSCHNHSV